MLHHVPMKKQNKMMGQFSSNIYFTIQDKPTNVRQNKIFDNIFFDKNQKDEYISDDQNVIRIDQMFAMDFLRLLRVHFIHSLLHKKQTQLLCLYRQQRNL